MSDFAAFLKEFFGRPVSDLKLFERAVTHAKAGFERVYRAAKLANLDVPIVEPLPAGGPRRSAG